MGILPFPNCVNGTYEYIATWISKHYVQQWMSCNIVPTIRTNGYSIFLNWIPCPFNYSFRHIHFGLFHQIYVQSMVWQGFVVDSRFRGCFHCFYERWVSHDIEGDVCFIKNSRSLLVQILFFGWIHFFVQGNLSKGLNVVICGFVKTFYVFCRGQKFEPLPLETLKQHFPSIEGFKVSMATSFVCPFGIWANTSMLLNGGGTSPPHWANSAFTRGCVFEHIAIPICPLLSYR